MAVSLPLVRQRAQPMVRLAKRDSNLVAAFVFAVTARAAHDDKCRMGCMADGVDGVAYRNCSATYRYCNNPDYYSDAFDCTLASSMLDTLDTRAAPNDDIRSWDNLEIDRKKNHIENLSAH